MFTDKITSGVIFPEPSTYCLWIQTEREIKAEYSVCKPLHAFDFMPPNIIVFHSSSSLLAYGSAVIDRLDFGRWVVQSKSRQTRQVASALSLSKFLHEVNTGWKVDKIWHTTSLTRFPARAPLLNFIPPSPSLPHSIFFSHTTFTFICCTRFSLRNLFL